VPRPPKRAHELLHDVADRLVGILPLAPGERVALSGRDLVEVVRVAHPEVHPNAAVALYGDEVQAVQLVWSDECGRWPWASNFNDGRGIQPVLGARANPEPPG
jgi:hypothetical protein